MDLWDANFLRCLLWDGLVGLYYVKRQSILTYRLPFSVLSNIISLVQNIRKDSHD